MMTNSLLHINSRTPLQRSSGTYASGFHERKCDSGISARHFTSENTAAELPQTAFMNVNAVAELPPGVLRAEIRQRNFRQMFYGWKYCGGTSAGSITELKCDSGASAGIMQLCELTCGHHTVPLNGFLYKK